MLLGCLVVLLGCGHQIDYNIYTPNELKAKGYEVSFEYDSILVLEKTVELGFDNAYQSSYTFCEGNYHSFDLTSKWTFEDTTQVANWINGLGLYEVSPFIQPHSDPTRIAYYKLYCTSRSDTLCAWYGSYNKIVRIVPFDSLYEQAYPAFPDCY